MTEECGTAPFTLPYTRHRGRAMTFLQHTNVISISPDDVKDGPSAISRVNALTLIVAILRPSILPGKSRGTPGKAEAVGKKEILNWNKGERG